MRTFSEPCSCGDPQCTSSEVTRLVDVATGERPKVGDMYYAPHMLENEFERSGLAPSYFAQRSQRPPIVVICPGGRSWCVDQRAYNHSQGGWCGEGWSVSGEPPLITCSPSINLQGSYHGFLQNGVLTDDCEGHRFTPEGMAA
jgi:hypothetical protein